MARGDWGGEKASKLCAREGESAFEGEIENDGGRSGEMEIVGARHTVYELVRVAV